MESFNFDSLASITSALDNLAIFLIFHLFDDGIHLVELGRCIFTNNVINRFNIFFINTLISSEHTHT